MARNVIRSDVIRIDFVIDQSPVSKLESSLNDIQSGTKETVSDVDKLATEAAKLGNKFEGAAKQSKKIGDSGKEAADVYSERWSAATDEQIALLKNAERIVENMQNQDLFRGLDDDADNMKDIGESAKKSETGIESLTKSADGLSTALAGAAAAFSVGMIVQNVTEATSAINTMKAATGATATEAEAYGESIRTLYGDAMGGSLQEVSTNLSLVAQQFKDLDPSEIESITNNAMAMADTFGTDVNETIRGVNALMTNMGLSAEEAFDYIAKGTQNGLDKSQELSDNISEYSQLWAQAGFSAEEMFSVLQNGLDSGAYNLDKVNDFVKEFSISLSDGRIGDNIDSFSQRTQDLFAAWQSGEATSKDVFQSVINDLGSMTNEQEALTVASNVWSALGEDNAMKVITSLNQTNDTYKDVKGTMESINEVRYDDIGSSFERLQRSGEMLLTETLTPALSGLNNMLSDGLDWLTEFASEHEALASGIMVAVTAAGLLTVGLIAVSGAIGLVTTAMTALNISTGGVLKIIGLVVAGVSVLAGAIAAFFSDSEDEVEDYNGTLEDCRYEIETLTAAHSDAVKRYGENSDAAKDLESQLDKLNAQYEKGGGYLGELQQKIEASSEAYQELSKSQEDVMSGIDDSQMRGMQAVSMLESLSSKAEITSTDLDTMSKYADYLNDTFNCNIEVNYDTGELTGFDPTVVTQQIIDAANDNRVQSAMDYLTGADFTGEYLDAAKNYYDAQAELRSLQTEFDGLAKTSWNDFNAERHYSDDSRYYKLEKQLEEAKETAADAENVISGLNNELDDYGNIIDDSGKTTEMFRDSLLDAAKSGNEFISFAEETSGSTSEITDGLSAAQSAVSDYSGELYTLAQAYDEAQESALESIQGQYQMWDEVGAIASTSIQTLQNNIQSQADYWASYNDNLATLNERASSIDGLAAMIQGVADGSEDSASAIAAMAGASDTELASMVSSWQGLQDQQGLASQSMADTATQFSAKTNSMANDMQALVGKMDMSSQASSAASSTINAFINTMVGTLNARSGEVTSAINALMSAANSANVTVNATAPKHASGTTNGEDVFIAGEQGAELVVGKQGSTVFPAAETNKIISAVQGYSGDYSHSIDSGSSKVSSNTTYAPQFNLTMNGASATDDNKRKVKQWIKDALNEMFDNLANDNKPVMEV